MRGWVDGRPFTAKMRRTAAIRSADDQVPASGPGQAPKQRVKFGVEACRAMREGRSAPASIQVGPPGRSTPPGPAGDRGRGGGRAILGLRLHSPPVENACHPHLSHFTSESAIHSDQSSIAPR